MSFQDCKSGNEDGGTKSDEKSFFCEYQTKQHLALWRKRKKYPQKFIRKITVDTFD